MNTNHPTLVRGKQPVSKEVVSVRFQTKHGAVQLMCECQGKPWLKPVLTFYTKEVSKVTDIMENIVLVRIIESLVDVAGLSG